MNKNLEKLTKAELISKLEQKQKVENSTVKKTIEKNPMTIFESIRFILKQIQTLFLSLSIVAILMKIFRNYKSIRATLRVMNYVILAMFGMSLYEAFGISMIIQGFGEFKFVCRAIILYIQESTFYTYLMRIFNTAVEQKDSIRGSYKKPVEIDWKAEYEKAETKREIDKWKERYENHKQNDENNKINKKTIALLILLLGGTITTWYYGPELLNIFSPVWNLSNLIRDILRGRRPDEDDDDDNNTIIFENKLSREGSTSPEMLVYSSDQVNTTPKASTSHNPPVAPPAPPAPPAPTEQGPPNAFLDSIRKGTKLRKTETVEKTGFETGKILGESETPSLMDALSNKLNKLRPMITGDESELEESKSGQDWDDNDGSTPTNKLDKGKGKEKFLDSIKMDNENKSTSSENNKIPPILKPILERFPNLSQETLEKLSTPEGLRNRHKIIQSLSDDELKTDITPFKYLPIKKIISDMSKDEQIKMDKIIKNTLNLDSEQLTTKLSREFPDYKFDVDSYKESFMKATEEEINSGKTEAEKLQITKEIQKVDLLEIQNTVGTSDTKEIKNVVRENYTHYRLLNEIKNKSSKTFEDLTDNDKIELDKISKNLKPDTLLNEIGDYGENNLMESLIASNVHNTIQKLYDDNPGISKQNLIEKLIKENPCHKEKILEIVSRTMDEQIAYLKHKISYKQFERMNKHLIKEDIKEMQNLGENRTEDQIRTLKSVNKSYNNILQEIKSKPSLTSIKPNVEKAQSQFSSKHLEDTMNLFD